MLATETFVKLCSVMVIGALHSDMRTSIASRSGLACMRLGTNSSKLKLNQKKKKREREWALGNCPRRMAIVAVTCFMDRTVGRTIRACSYESQIFSG